MLNDTYQSIRPLIDILNINHAFNSNVEIIQLIKMFKQYYTVLFLFIFYICNSNQQQTKIWVSNTNYINPKNWLQHTLPCESSKIVFPDDLNTAIYLPANIKIQEINLPNDGELILKQDGFIEFTDKSEIYENCKQKDMTFKKINIEPWLKSTNWQIKNHKKENIAIPHAERTPCQYDNVIFPNESSFWVQYPEVTISVNSFNIEGKYLSNYELQSFLLSEPGDRQFKNLDYQDRNGVINVKNMKCEDLTGCLCHENKFIEDAVCKNLKPICGATHCIKPVKPIGYCCQMCGAYLLLTIDGNKFNFKKFTEHVHEYLYISGYTSLDVHTSKVFTENKIYIQIIIIEKDFNYKGDSISAAENLHYKFMSNLVQNGLLTSKLYMSGPEYWPGQQLKATIGIILGTLTMVLITLIIIYFIYGTEKGSKFSLPFNAPNFRNFRPFIFVRFENSGDGDGGLEFRNRSVASSLFNLDRAFDNPMFGEEPAAGPSGNGTSSDEVNKLEYSNPLYSELQKHENEE